MPSEKYSSNSSSVYPKAPAKSSSIVRSTRLFIAENIERWDSFTTPVMKQKLTYSLEFFIILKKSLSTFRISSAVSLSFSSIFSVMLLSYSSIMITTFLSVLLNMPENASCSIWAGSSVSSISTPFLAASLYTAFVRENMNLPNVDDETLARLKLSTGSFSKS